MLLLPYSEDLRELVDLGLKKCNLFLLLLKFTLQGGRREREREREGERADRNQEKDCMILCLHAWGGRQYQLPQRPVSLHLGVFGASEQRWVQSLERHSFSGEQPLSPLLQSPGGGGGERGRRGGREEEREGGREGERKGGREGRRERGREGGREGGRGQIQRG